MSEFFKRKKALLVTLCALFVAITLLAGSMAYLLGGEALRAGLLGQPKPDEPSAAEPEESEVNEEAPPEATPEPEPVVHNTPSTMRGVFLTPGIDILTGSDFSEAVVKKQIDAAIANISELSMNTVIIDTAYGEKAIYDTTGAARLVSDYDPMRYIIDQARAAGLYTYALFDASHYPRKNVGVVKLAVGSGESESGLSGNLMEFAEKYAPDGILIDGYQNLSATDSYSTYLSTGGAIGFDNFMRQTPEAIVKTAVKAVRKANPNTVVGLLADSVWANIEDNAQGSNTKAEFTSLGTANADTRAFVEQELVDFIAVKAYTSLTDTNVPFGEVVSWWSDVVSETGLPLYVVHASDRACTENPGWQSHDQLTRQVIECEAGSGYCGSIFNNLARLVENPKETTATLVKYYNNEVEAEHILTELAVTKPEQNTFETYEPTMTFTGASDPNSPVLFNGEDVPTDASGYFTLTVDLEAGLNEFVIEHKEKTLTYAITRKVQILKDISPKGEVTTEGGMTLTISATAYMDAQVMATVGGKTITLAIDEDNQVEEDRDSNYKLFTGEYTVPAATESVQNLGAITVNASWEGMSESLQGASVKVNKKARLEDGVPVVVTASQAKIYPPNTANNIPSSSFFPLPQGAMDYAVGDEIVYKKNNETYKYYVLASGVRVSSSDIAATDDYASGNVISGLTVKSEGHYTYVTLKMLQKVSYRFTYAHSGLSITFNYTNTVPKDMTLDQNPLFTAAKWTDTTLNLPFVKDGAFTGYKGYYDENGNLVLRFINPTGSLSGTKICIDPGHGGADIGALGFLREYPERVLNLQIAKKVVAELESRGATVHMLDTSQGMSLLARVQAAEKWGADIFVSIHNNSSTNSGAYGTETYYFAPYSATLATHLSKNVSAALNTTNRGARQSYYHITLSSQMQSVLLEGGFVSNRNEYEKLLKSANQQRMAEGIADAMETTVRAMRTGVSAGDEQSVGGTVSAGNEASGITDDISSADDSNSALRLNKESIKLEVGASYTLKLSGLDDGDDVTWDSGNTSVATVDDDGRVTGVREGKAKITATASNGDKAVCNIEVIGDNDGIDTLQGDDDDDNGNKPASQAKSVYFSSEEVTLEAGKSRTLTIKSDIGDIRPTDFVWESSDESVVTVNKNGKITARKRGEAEITAICDEYGFGIFIAVYVTD